MTKSKGIKPYKVRPYQPALGNSLAEMRPDVAARWWSGNELRPDQVSFGSHKKAKFVCDKGHIYESVIYVQSRAQSGVQGCSVCHGIQVTIDNCLAIVRPDIAARWWPDNEFGSDEVTEGSNKKAKFVCDKGHIYESVIKDQSKGHGCGVCANAGQSTPATLWLKSLGIPQLLYEWKIPGTRWRADGYDPSTNTIYEFHGDDVHGCLKPYACDRSSAYKKIPMTEVYARTIDREQKIRDLDYNLVVEWFSHWRQWEKLKRQFPWLANDRGAEREQHGRSSMKFVLHSQHEVDNFLSYFLERRI